MISGATHDRLVVVGGGQAAAQMIEVARQEGFAGPVTLVSDEPLPPYQRPPLSKQYLTGKYGEDWLLYRPQDFYARHNVGLRLGHAVSSIDCARRQVLLADGSLIEYDRLALATGARARQLDVPGGDLPGVFSIRTASDTASLRACLETGKRIVVIGGGFIGLEAAAALVQTGRDVTLLARQDRLIGRVVPPEVSRFLTEQHLMRGVTVKLHRIVAEVRRSTGPHPLEVICAGPQGECYPADAVIVGIGALANTELAVASGIDCDDGIIVDEHARIVADGSLLAAGDCTNHPNALLRRRLRLETVHNAVEQGRTAGLTLAGRLEPYSQTPWVWSDQFQFRLQSVGLADGHDRRVIRGSLHSGRFSIFQFLGDALLGVTTINQPRVFGAVRRILNSGAMITPAQAEDTEFDLNAVVSRTGSMTFDLPWEIRRRGPPASSWGHS